MSDQHTDSNSLEGQLAAARHALDAGDIDEALASWQRALASMPAATAARADVLDEVARVARRGGRIQEALSPAEEALAIRDALGDLALWAEAALLLADLQLLNGDVRAATKAYDQVFGSLDAIGDAHGDDLRAHAVARHSLSACLNSSWGEVLPWARQGIELAERLGLPEIAAHCLINMGMAQTMLGERDAGITSIREGRARAELADSVEETARSFIVELNALAREGRFRDALRIATSGADYASRGDAPAGLRATLAVCRTQYQWLTGQWQLALDSLPDLERLVQAQSSDIVRCQHLALSARIATARGHLPDAERLLQLIRDLAPKSTESQLQARLSQVRLRLAQQRLAEALDCVVDTFEEFGQVDDLGFAELAVLGLVAACRLGVRDGAVARLYGLVDELPNPRRLMVRFYRHLASGFDAFQNGRANDALSALSAALEGAQRMASPQWEVEIHHWLASALQQRGADEDGLEAARQRQAALGILQGIPGYAPSDAA